jgi:DNA-directed RNA polymerase subunit M/transcription elongation factor TFIIS
MRVTRLREVRLISYCISILFEMLFCPSCANILLVDSEGGQAFNCQTCPYTFQIRDVVRIDLSIAQQAAKQLISKSTDSWSSFYSIRLEKI